MITALLTRWAGGHLDVVDLSVYGDGVREEGFFRAGDSQYTADAEELAAAILARMAGRDEKLQIAWEGAFTGTIGDTLTAPDSAGTPASWRVVAINYTHDREGNVLRVPLVELVT